MRRRSERIEVNEEGGVAKKVAETWGSAPDLARKRFSALVSHAGCLNA